ncbi:MAG: hypothetical protein PHG55_09460 [Verrucomicrobiota bacterium]|nr:hypothetical protein [Verrucomicrobiota bacterium]
MEIGVGIGIGIGIGIDGKHDSGRKTRVQNFTTISLSSSISGPIVRISNAEGNVGSSYLNFDIKRLPAEGVKPNPPVGEYRYELPKYLVMARHIERSLYLRVPDENRSPSFHYVVGVGDRDNGRLEIDLNLRYGRIVLSPTAAG